MNPPTREWQMPGLPEIEAFQVAMAEAGYHRAVLNGRGDGFLFDRDEDRWFGWRLARAAPKAPPMPDDVREAIVALQSAIAYHNRALQPLLDWLRAQGLVSAKE